MKSRTFAVLLVLASVTLFTGCAAYFGNEAQYNKGDWYLFADSREVAHIKKDKLAFNKLEAEPVKTNTVNGVSQGYEGLVANLSNNNRYNFKLFGPETKSYLLGPGERATDYLIPGKYVCIVYQGSYQVGSWSFQVGPQQSIFMNEKHHWYIYTDR
ncbi:MAG: hypothetical protein Q7R92_03745 [bacterium]|nr:hypothetical protein [bacterium]